MVKVSVIPESARLPGAALGDVAPVPVNYVAELEDVSRGEVAGYYAQRFGTVRQLRPRLSRKAYEDLLVTRLPEVPGYLESLLGSAVRVPADVKSTYLLQKKAVRQELVDGSARIVVVPRVPESKDEVEILGDEGARGVEVVSEVVSGQLEGREKKKSYTLSQIFQDFYIQEKYQLRGRMLETAKRMVATDPVATASMLQDVMNSVQVVTSVRVTAGDYLRNKAHAKTVLGAFCSHYKATSASVAGEVIGEKLFMYGPEGDLGWHVCGPLKYAAEVSYVYWVVSVEGPMLPSVLLSMELVLLGIDIYDGNTYAEPLIEYHTGGGGEAHPPVGLSPRTTGLLSVDQRFAMLQFGDRLLPVMSSAGEQMATAVRVTDRHVLINTHVVEADALCTVAGERVKVQTQLSRDLWSVEIPGSAAPWSMREPTVGEKAVVCYRAGGVVSCSPPLNIVSADNSCVVTSLDPEVVHGVSGGALVALSDFSLLGVHSASTLTSLISFKFGASQFSTLLDVGAESVFSRESDAESFAARVYRRFKDKGLGHVFEASLKSVVPVYVGSMHVGMAVNSGQYLYTTCDADLPLRFGVDRKAYVFETSDVGTVYRVKLDRPAKHTPVFRRRPEVFEKVFIVGTDSEEYLSCETSVQHVGPNARSFVIGDIPGADKPMLGGLVVARDGAVLGMCGPRSATTQIGLGYVCWPLPEEKVVSGMDVRTMLSRRFPFLNLQAWSDNLIEEVFTHSSAGKYRDGRLFNTGCKPLANVGDNAAKAELYASLREKGLPHSRWSMVMQQCQSNATFATAAWDNGYAEYLIAGLGATFMPSSKAYADLTEALLGAAYMVERRGVFRQLCKVLGVLGEQENDMGSALSVDSMD